MSLKKRRQRNELREKFINRALEQTGYTARANGVSIYGETVGYSGSGQPWDGAFIDVVARECGLKLTAHVSTASALSHYARTYRLHTKPQRGDVVFFGFSADAATAFNGPHVGVVVDVAAWDSKGMIQTVEAQTSSGLPKGAQLNDGVYKRIRYSTDVIGFGRPEFESSELNGNLEVLPVVAAARVRSGKPNRDVENVQLALAKHVGARDMNRGTWCPVTRAAFANFQRSIGLLGPSANGVPEDSTLQRLGKETGLFRV